MNMGCAKIVFKTLAILLIHKESGLATSSSHDENHNTNSKSQDTHGTAVTREIEQMLREHSYELSLRPSRDEGATTVGFDLLIESITDISEKDMDVTFTFGLHETWNDPRLRLNSISNDTSVVLPSRLVKQIWVPDIYVVGSKHSFIHTTSVDNTVIRLFGDGTVFYSLRITTTVACQMNLYNFPLDQENCSLAFQSLGYDSDEMSLYWTDGDNIKDMHVFMDENLVRNMPKFQLRDFILHKTDIPWEQMHSHPGAKRSRIKISFGLNRYLLSVFFQSYFPAIATVMLAGLGMWLDPKAVPARVALGVTSVLTISTIISGLKASLPKVSYLTALDMYLWTCFLFVFSTMIEFCVLNYRFRNNENKKKSEKILVSPRNRIKTCSRLHRILTRNKNLDVWFRRAYFTAFLMFNCFYWVYYGRK